MFDLVGPELDPLALADAAFRFGAITLFLLLAAAVARRLGRRWVGRFGALAGLGVAAYLVCPFLGPPAPATLPLIAICVVNPALVWLFGRALFEDDFAPGPMEWSMPAVLLLLWACRQGALAAGAPALSGGLALAHQAVQLGLALHLIWRVWRDRQDDLVETRRRFRQGFVAVGAAFLVVISAIELWLAEEAAVPALLLFQSVAFWTLAVWLALAALRFRAGLFFMPTEADAQGQPPADAGDPDAARILALMEADRLYLEPGLMLGDVAARAGVPEYRARQLINTVLGYRNFPDFLNGFRIEEAARRLADPELRRLPILTIALDVGFNSIGPFNRAFKGRLGMTPSAYRASAFGA